MFSGYGITVDDIEAAWYLLPYLPLLADLISKDGAFYFFIVNSLFSDSPPPNERTIFFLSATTLRDLPPLFDPAPPHQFLPLHLLLPFSDTLPTPPLFFKIINIHP